MALTQKEWFKAQRFRDADYLYAVMNTATGPQLYRVKNLAENVAPEERVEGARHVVPSEQIRIRGERSARKEKRRLVPQPLCWVTLGSGQDM